MNQPGFQPAPQMPMNQTRSKNHGGHEFFDAHEVMSSLISMLDQYQIYNPYVRDPELKSILQRHSSFATQLYNTIVDCFQTGQDPAVPTQQYRMSQNNDVVFGLTPGKPKKPAQSTQEISDQTISGFMLGNTKSLASLFAMTALEITNPVLRRVVADSVPNLIELSYEIFLYQNKHGYYQVPQLKEQDMNLMLNSYSKAAQNGYMPH